MFQTNKQTNKRRARALLSPLPHWQGALAGKPVDNVTGAVDHAAPALTPQLQLLIVVYTFELNSTLCPCWGCVGNTKGYSSTDLAMGFANARAGAQ